MVNNKVDKSTKRSNRSVVRGAVALMLLVIVTIIAVVTISTNHSESRYLEILRGISIVDDYSETSLEIIHPPTFNFSATSLSLAERLLAIEYKGEEAEEQALRNLRKQGYEVRVANRTAKLRGGACTYISVIGFKKQGYGSGSVVLNSATLTQSKCDSRTHKDHSVTDKEFASLNVSTAEINYFFYRKDWSSERSL